MENEILLCDHCGCEIHPDEAYNFNDNVLCQDCIDDETFICDNCGERFWNDDNDGDNSISICGRCRDYHYTTCEYCGCLIHNDCANYLEDDDEYPYCDSCFERQQNSVLHPYSYKPKPIFYGMGKRFYGVELEIDEAGKITANADTITKAANSDYDHIYIKTDGSLNDGLEIVTHPMTLDYHKQCMPWNKVLKTALSLGYRSHKTTTCGLHVHVNRNTFGSTHEIQEECISRVLYFVEHHWEELLKFSRRTQYQMNRWAARYGYKNQPKEILEAAKKGCNGRYTCVNITNRDTIEFRMFRGTLKLNTIIATLQLIQQICDIATDLTDEEIAEISWTDFVTRLDKTNVHELITYLKERRLYVNEPIEYKEDD